MLEAPLAIRGRLYDAHVKTAAVNKEATSVPLLDLWFVFACILSSCRVGKLPQCQDSGCRDSLAMQIASCNERRPDRCIDWWYAEE